MNHDILPDTTRLVKVFKPKATFVYTPLDDDDRHPVLVNFLAVYRSASLYSSPLLSYPIDHFSTEGEGDKGPLGPIQRHKSALNV